MQHIEEGVRDISNPTSMSGLRGRIEAFLAAHHVMSLATPGLDGPHIANFFYAHDSLVLIWVSEPTSHHSREIDTEPCVAATITADYADFARVRGLQIRVAARKVGQNEHARYLTLLETRYAILKRTSEGPKKMHDAYAQSAAYCLDPNRIVLIDNTRRFGHKEMLAL